MNFLLSKVSKTNLYTYLILSVPLSWYFHQMVLCYEGLTEGNVLSRINQATNQYMYPFQHIFAAPTKLSIMATIVFILSYFLAGIYYLSMKGNYRHGEEYGSARFANKQESELFKNKKDPDNQIILTKTEQLTLETKMKDPNLNRTKNVAVIGGAGSGKTFTFVKPNLMQLSANYIVTETKAVLQRETGKMFRDAGYDVKIFDLANLESHLTEFFNPFHYIRDDRGIIKAVNNLITNTEGKGERASEDFWVKAETMCFYSLFGYVQEKYKDIPDEEATFDDIRQLLLVANTMENETDRTALDIVMERFAEEYGEDHFVYEMYTAARRSAMNTWKSILISMSVRLAPLGLPSVKKLVSKDTLELDKMGEGKRILYLSLSDTDHSLNFLLAMLLDLAIDTLYHVSREKYHGHELPRLVLNIWDEFANIGTIPTFPQYISTSRSRGIFFMPIIQALSQFKQKYEKSWEEILASCDSLLYLGSNEKDIHKYMSELAGKETIDMIKVSKSYGRSGGMNKNYEKHARDLMTPDEVANLRNDECLLKIRGIPMFKSKKYIPSMHKRYQLLSNSPDDGQWFNYYITHSAEENLEYQLNIAKNKPENGGTIDVTDVA
ncbi:type IV secretory system conjugative DNA transfer family protein [Enterococcus cecorum]